MSDDVLTGGPEGPELIGREEEMEILISALQKAAEGRGSMILIEGEAGIGKTHLLSEFSNSARSRGFSVLWGRCLHYRKSPHLPFIEMLKDHFGVSTLDDYETNREKVRNGLNGHPIVEKDLFIDFSDLFIPRDEPVGGYKLEKSRSKALVDFLAEKGYRTIFLGRDEEIEEGEASAVPEIIRIGPEEDESIPPNRLERIARTLKVAFDRYRHLAVVNECLDTLIENNPEEKVHNLISILDELALKNSGMVVHLSDEKDGILSDLKDLGIHIKKEFVKGNRSNNGRLKKGMSVNDLFTTFISEESTRIPQLMILEDLQWGDKPSLNLLQYLARKIVNKNLLIVGSYRPEEYGLEDEGPKKAPLRDALQRISREKLFETLTLDRLNRKDQAILIETITGGEIDENLIDEVSMETEGNPLLIKQFLKERKKTKTSVKLADQLELDAITRRIENLDESSREMLELASVLGMESSLDMLVKGLDIDEEEALDRLDSLLNLRLVQETEEGVRFEHPKARSLIYESIQEENLKNLHSKAASLLESSIGPKEESKIRKLAEHYMLSGDLHKAFRAYIESAEQLMEMMDDRATLSDLERALDCIEKLPVSKEKDIQLVKVLQMIGDVNEKAGDTKTALMAFKRAVDVAEKRDIPYGQSSSYRRIGDIMLKLFEWDQTVDYYLRSLHVSKKEDDQEEIAKAFRGLGIIYYLKGDYTRSMDCYLKYMEFPKKEKKPLNVMALIEVGNIYFEMGDFNQALTYYKLGIRRGEEADLKQESAYSYTRMANVLIKLRELEDAKRFATWGFNMVKDHVSSEISQRVVLEYIELMLESGDLARAEEAMSLVQKVPERELEDRLLKGQRQRTIGLYLSKKRDFDGSIKHLNEALEINESLQVPFQLGLTTLYYGLVLFQQMKVEEAMEMLKRSSKTFKSIGALYYLNRTSSKLRELTFIKESMNV
jgi:predicted ATPase